MSNSTSIDLIPFVKAIVTSDSGAVTSVLIPTPPAATPTFGLSALSVGAYNIVYNPVLGNYAPVTGRPATADALTPTDYPFDVTGYSMVWNGATWDRAAEGQDIPFQAVSSVGQIATVSKGLTFDGAKWYRMTSLNDNLDGNSPTLGQGSITAGAKLFAFNNSSGNFDRLRCGPDTIDNQNVVGPGNLSTLSKGMAWNGATWDRLRTPNVFKTVSTAAAGNTALWTPAAGLKFRLMRVHMSITSNAAAAAAAVLLSQLLDGATFFGISDNNYIPLAGVIQQHQNFVFDLGNGYLSAAANNVLNINLSFALTAGILDVTVAGTEE